VDRRIRLVGKRTWPAALRQAGQLAAYYRFERASGWKVAVWKEGRLWWAGIKQTDR
jgi:hypothetical protein